jgi:ubiquinone biosynthesis monooxygenase Coq7
MTTINLPRKIDNRTYLSILIILYVIFFLLSFLNVIEMSVAVLTVYLLIFTVPSFFWLKKPAAWITSSSLYIQNKWGSAHKLRLSDLAKLSWRQINKSEAILEAVYKNGSIQSIVIHDEGEHLSGSRLLEFMEKALNPIEIEKNIAYQECETNKEVARIIRVDHAGELGAINIYRAQILVAELLYKDIVPELVEMQSHEKEHFTTFSNLLKKRTIRSCYALWFWAIGGFLLGLLTALLGRNAIWITTNAIETTVLHHLDWQLDYLKQHDQEAYAAVLSIKADEEAHRDLGQNNSAKRKSYTPIFWLVSCSTKSAIWLSTKL